MGDMLGGQPEDPSCYTDGKVDYDKVAQKEFYQKGIARLQEASRKGLHVAIMCSEGKPEMCHRTKLISRTLIQLGIEVRHINEEDQLITQEQAMYRLTDHQPSLFGDEFFKFTSRKRYQDQEE